MKQHRMTDGERKLFHYAGEIMRGPADPLVSEKIARVYRNLLVRSRAHEIEEVGRNIDLLERISRERNPSVEAVEGTSDGAVIAFAALIGHDLIAALSLIDRLGDRQLPTAMMEALKALSASQVTLYELWRTVSAKVSDAALQASTSEWLAVAVAYSRAMLPTNPLAAFFIWQQAFEWNQRFPSAATAIVLTELAYQAMAPNARNLYRMNSLLWEAIQDQGEACSQSDELGQAAKMSSLFAALEMTKAEIAQPETDEFAVRGIWETAMTWMTDDMLSHSAWSTLEGAMLSTFAAKPLTSFATVEARLKVLSQKWVELGKKSQQSIQVIKERAAWVDGPLYSADWTEIEEEGEIQKILWPLAMPGGVLDGKRSMIDRVRLWTPSFYPDQQLVEVQVRIEDGTRAICSVLLSGHRAAVLAGKSDPIHMLNARGALKVHKDSVALDYVRFFCGAVWGESSPFRIVERVDDIPLLDSANEEIVTSLHSLFERHPCVITHVPDGTWEVSGLVCYANALHQVQLKVLPSGMVEMLSDEPLIVELPVRKIVMRDGFRCYEGVWEKS